MFQVQRVETHDHIGHGFGGQGIAAGHHHVVLEVLARLRTVSFGAPESFEEGVSRRIVREQVHVPVLGVVLVVLALGGAVPVRARGQGAHVVLDPQSGAVDGGLHRGDGNHLVRVQDRFGHEVAFGAEAARALLVEAELRPRIVQPLHAQALQSSARDRLAAEGRVV